MGLIGARHLAKSGVIPRGIPIINLDIPLDSSGRLGLNTGFLVPWVRCDPDLTDLVKDTAKDMGLKVFQNYVPIGAGADHMIFYKHGYRVTSMLNMFRGVHSEGDTVDRLPQGALTTIVTLVKEINARLHEA